MKLFKDRAEAGKLLAAKLKNVKADLVLGIPRGGVVVAASVAKELKLPMDILVTRKIGAPHQEELALGAVDPDGQVVFDESLIRQYQISNISKAFLLLKQNVKYQIEEEKEEIKRREEVYRQGRKSLNVTNKTVILIDDGMATGATVLSAVKYLKRHQAKVILAVPVASKEALEKVENELEQMVVLETPEYFQAVGQFYENFQPVTDKEVVELLNGK